MGGFATYSGHFVNAILKLSADLLDALKPALVRRGRALLGAGAVKKVRRGQLDGMVVLSGLVDDGGEQPFSVYLTVEDGELAGDCSCTRGAQCEHVAALYMAGMSAEDEPVRPRPLAVNQPAAAMSPLVRSVQYMVYLMRLADDRSELSVCPSRVAPAAGGQAVTTPYSLSRLSDSRQPDYLNDADLAILHALADRMADATDLVWYPLGPASQKLLDEMISTGRCRWESVNGPVLSLAEPLVASLEWELLPSGYQRLSMVTGIDEDDGPALQLPLLPPWRFNPETGRCRALSSGADDKLLADLLGRGLISPEDIDALIDDLKQAGDPALPLPCRLAVERAEAVAPVPQLTLLNAEVGTGRRFEIEPAARLAFAYGPVSLDWDDEYAARLLGDDGSTPRVVMIDRDHAAEEACAAMLERSGLVAMHASSSRDYRPGEGGLWVAADRQRRNRVWVDFQRGLAELRAAGWQIELVDDLALELVEPDDWYGDLLYSDADPASFELDLGVIAKGERLSLLPALLDWLERTPEAVLRMLLSGEPPDADISLGLDQRRVVQMPMDRLALTLRGLVDFLDRAPKLADGKLRLPRARLAELAEAGSVWSFGGDEGLAELSRRLADFDHIEPLPEPEGLKAELRGYQRFGLGWLQFLREFGFGGILADDMGLGKTIQTLAHLLAEKRAGRMDKPCLVIAPTSLMFNWRAEARRFAPELKVLMLHGPARKGEFQWIRESDLVLTTYPLLPRDLDLLARQDWHLLILDEAQAIKNPRARVSRAVRELSARHRLCLTGTPLENHLGELWSLFDFLMPGFLGSQTRFRELFQTPIERRHDEDRREILARRIRPFFLRRTKAAVAPELPPKTEITRAVALDGNQRRLYERVRVALHDKVRKALAMQGVDRSRIVVLDALLKLRQICCDPRLLKDIEAGAGIGSAKLELLMDLLPEQVAEGRRVLLFSQFVGMLELIEAEVKKAGIDYVKLTGRTRDRQKVVERFQTGEVPLFLISLKAGGVGLNLTAADTVIHYDPWWNPAVEDQATDRAHRIGQDQKVFVYRLLTEDTIEQKVHEMQQSKRGLVEGLLGGGGAAALSPDDLDALFEPLG